MRPFAWQRVIVPMQEKWAPVKLEGDATKGGASFADLHRPRLGLRWQRVRRVPADPEAMLRRVMKEEVGALGLKEASVPEVLPAGASHALVYEDIEPYRRDFALAYFPAAKCVVGLSYPLRRRENVLQNEILPGVTVVPDDAPAPWSVFGLSCLTPPALRLERHRLNAGDLSLTFVGPRAWRGLRPPTTWAVVREIAVPELALKRTKLEGWLRTLQAVDARFFKPAKASAPTTLTAAATEFAALRLDMPRKRRWRWLGSTLPKSCLTLGGHDPARDRLVLLHGTDETLLREIAATLGVGVGEPASA